MKVYGQLEKAQAEVLGSDPTPVSDGRFYFLSTLAKLKYHDGSAWQKIFSSRDEALDLTETTTPSTPAATKFKVYVKSDGNLYVLDSGGSESLVAAQAPTNLFDRDSDGDVTVAGNTTLQVMRHRVVGGDDYVVSSGGGLESNSNFFVEPGSTLFIASSAYLRVV